MTSVRERQGRIEMLNRDIQDGVRRIGYAESKAAYERECQEKRKAEPQRLLNTVTLRGGPQDGKIIALRGEREYKAVRLRGDAPAMIQDTAPSPYGPTYEVGCYRPSKYNDCEWHWQGWFSDEGEMNRADYHRR